MKVLVVGSTGTVGSATANVLRERGMEVRCMTRSPDKLVALPACLHGRIGDLTDETSLAACFEDCDGVFMVLALSESERGQGLNAVQAAVHAGVKKFVYMSVYMPEGTDHILHMGGKKPIEDAVRDSRMAHVILRPNSFFQNELRTRVPLLQYHIFPTPFGHKGATRIDVRDIADAVATLFETSDYDGKTIELHGPEVLTGPEMASVWSQHLGERIAYTGDDIEAWEAAVSPFLPSWLTPHLRAMYEYVVERGFRGTNEAIQQTKHVVGHPLRTYDAFVSETVAAWKSEG